MSDMSIPGVTDAYGTKDLISGLMEVERIPLTREETRLEEYETQQNAWRDVNTHMSTLRETAKNLYSFDNPFSLKIANSTEENAITVSPDRDADFDTFKIEVLQTATADRFLSKEIESDAEVEEGTYSFRVNEKTIKLNWKGGELKDFVAAINRRSADTVKASLIGITRNTKSLLIESLIPGAENRLHFEDDAVRFAKDIGMIKEAPAIQETTFPLTASTMKNTKNLFSSSIQIQENLISLPPKTGFESTVPDNVNNNSSNFVKFSAHLENIPVEAIQVTEPNLPSSGYVHFNNITIENDDVQLNLPPSPEPEPIIPTEDFASVFIKTVDGIEIPLDELPHDGNVVEFSIDIDNYPSIDSIVIKNNNSHKYVHLSPFEVFNASSSANYIPTNAVEVAQDAKFKYQGITISRPSNEIDDVIPNVTLNLHSTTEKPATITIEPDTETAKESLITFVAQYNRLMAELNILTQDNEDIIGEISYFDDAEIEKAEERLGMFRSEYALTSTKNNLQQITANPYIPNEESTINMLSQIGISTSASTGGFTGISQSRLRGYLEINEDVLDKALKNNIIDIKNLFGYDSNEDLAIDSGLAYRMDNQLYSYTQTGGIIASKNSSIKSQIETTQGKIASLEEKLEDTEQKLKVQFGQMESALNSLESQSSAIDNFSKQNSGQ